MEIGTVIGIDAHSQRHSAAAIDSQGRTQAALTVGASREELAHLLAWVQQQPGPRLVAVEGVKSYGRSLTLAMLAAGETVVDVATHLTVESRRRSRRPRRSGPTI